MKDRGDNSGRNKLNKESGWGGVDGSRERERRRGERDIEGKTDGRVRQILGYLQIRSLRVIDSCGD